MAPSFEARSLAWRVRFRTRSGRNISLSFQDHSDAVNFESDVTADPPDSDDERLATRSKRQKVKAAGNSCSGLKQKRPEPAPQVAQHCHECANPVQTFAGYCKPCFSKHLSSTCGVVVCRDFVDYADCLCKIDADTASPSAPYCHTCYERHCAALAPVEELLPPKAPDLHPEIIRNRCPSCFGRAPRH